MTKGVLLINLGTPDSPETGDVRRYLREFLSDKRVINLPAVLRYLLLYGVILPFRTPKTAHAYRMIWTAEGSPLRAYSERLRHALQIHLGSDYTVALGMRYGKPSLGAAIEQLQACDTITILPLYPQYSSAATGSSIQRALEILTPLTTFPSLHVIRDFHKHASYIHAQAAQISPYISGHDYVLFSYHGLPESHLLDGGCQRVCASACPTNHNPSCYRAQCQKTSALLAATLHLTENNYGSAFQSRLGKTEWIKPYTDDVLEALTAQGIKRLAIACPSFVTDCLETLEEIGLRAKAQWHALGGTHFTFIPCMNDNDDWIKALADLITPPHCL